MKTNVTNTEDQVLRNSLIRASKIISSGTLCSIKRSPMSFEDLENCFPEGATSDNGYIQVSAQWLHDFGRNIELYHDIK